MGLAVKRTGYLDHLNRNIGFPIANQGDGGKHVIDYQVYFGTTASQSNPIQIIGGADTIIQLSQGTWDDIGIVAGDVINFRFIDIEEEIVYTGSAAVLSIDGSSLRVESPLSSSFVSLSGYLYTNKMPQGIEVDYNLIPSTQNTGIESIIDSSISRFRVGNLNSLIVGNSLTLNQIGQRSGSIINEIKVTRTANEIDPLSFGTVLNYRVEVSFNWWGYLSVIHEPYFFDARTITPIISTKIFPQFNNYGVMLENTHKLPTDGNSGFRNENFNQGQSAFNLVSTIWTDVNDNPIPAFDYSQTSKFKSVITSTSGFGANFGMLFFNDIQDLTSISAGINNDNGQYTTAQLTLFGQTAGLTVGGGGSMTTAVGKNGELLQINNISITISGNTATITGECNPNAEFINKFSDDDNFEKRFALLFRCETPTFSQPNYSTTVNTLLWSGVGEVAPVVLGAYEFRNEVFLGHNNMPVSVGNPVMIEDDNVYSAEFEWERRRVLKSITYRNVVINRDTLEWFTLESYRVPLDETIQWGGIQDMPSDIGAYFKPYMPTIMNNFQHNDFKLFIADQTQPNFYKIGFQFPMLQRWEYWLGQVGVATLFNQTANKDWISYAQIGSWVLSSCIELEVNEGTYRNFYDYKLDDYDRQPALNCDWHFERQDSTVVSAPIAGEVCKVVATWTFGEPINVTWGQITVEPFESSPRWMLSSVYASPTQPLNPLSNDSNAGFISIVNNNTTEVRFECYIDPNKINTANGIKFTARINTDKELLYDREEKLFKVVQLPNIPVNNGRGSLCCDCEPELVLAHVDDNNGYKNDFKTAWHKLDVEGDECRFEIYKDGEQLPNYGEEIIFPDDDLLRGFAYNWRSYLTLHGGGCYTIKKILTIVGLEFDIEFGHYSLMPYDIHTSEGTTRIMGQYNKEVSYNEYGVRKVANFSNSGFETCFRFNGYFGSWQPNAEIINHYAWNGMLRNAKIRYRGTYALIMNATSRCKYEYLVKEMLLFSSIFKCSDYNYTNPIQTAEVFWTVLNDEESPEITYNESSRKASVIVSMKDMYNNEVSRVDGSINPLNGVSYALATIGSGGSGGVCVPALATVKNSLGTVVASQSIASGNEATLLAPNSRVVVRTLSNIVIADVTVASGVTQTVTIANPSEVELTVNQQPFITAVAPIQDIGIVNENGGFGVVTTNANDVVIPNEEVEIYVNDVLHSIHSAVPFEINVINITI